MFAVLGAVTSGILYYGKINADKVTVDNVQLQRWLTIYQESIELVNTLEEDLQFLKANINDKIILYSVEVGGLITAGLAYYTGVSENNKPRYNFTELAKLVNRCAINGDTVNRIEEFHLNEPAQNVFFKTYEKITVEEIQSIVDVTYINK